MRLGAYFPYPLSCFAFGPQIPIWYLNNFQLPSECRKLDSLYAFLTIFLYISITIQGGINKYD